MSIGTPLRLEPFRIIAFHSPDRGDASPVFTEVDSFEAQYDPDSYSRQFTNVFEGPQTIGINTSLPNARYAYSQASQLRFQIILDATPMGGNAITDLLSAAATSGVTEEVERFLEVCYDYDGEIHQPRFLRVEWGTLSCACRLQSVDVQYIMFDRNGTPIRAKLDTVFVGDVSEETRTRTEDRRSPDLAKVHTVKAGESLPLLAQKAYNSSTYYLDLARYNQLDHFRELKSGMEIRLPSLEELLNEQNY